MISNEQLPSLPTEVQYNIFSHLTFNERLRCSTVCRSCHSLILNWPGMWATLSTADGHNIATNIVPYTKYIQGSDVRSLFMNDEQKPDENPVSEVIDFVVERRCKRIEHARFLVNQMNMASFLKLAIVCGSSLTRVIVTVTKLGPSDITPNQILLYCPNLKKLYFHCRESIDMLTWISSSAEFQHQNLIELALLVYQQCSEVDPSPLFRSAPNLQRLSLFPTVITGDASLFLSSLCHYYPSLTSLYLCDNESTIMEVTDIDSEEQQTPGLRELVLQDYYTDDSYTIFLRQVFEKSHQKLTALNLEHFNLCGEETLKYLSVYTFPSLKHLTLDCEDCSYHPDHLLAFLAQSVPNIRSLKLGIERFSGTNEDSLPQTTVLNMKYLEHVEFSRDSYFTLDQLVKFFDLMASGSLRIIVFHCMQALTAQVLNIIATKFSVIDELVVDYCHNISIQEISSFLNRWSSDRHMNKLRIVAFKGKAQPLAAPSTFTQDEILELLASMNKAAKLWTFHTIVPQTWDAFPYKSLEYLGAQRGEMSDVEYKTYERRFEELL